MSGIGILSHSVLPDPAVSTVIFSPRAQNYTLLSVSTQERLSEAIALECLVNIDESFKRKIFENMRRAVNDNPVLIADYLRTYFQTAYIAVTPTLPSDVIVEKFGEVPPRTFPFCSHLNLLSSPVEGMLFDPDDFFER